MATAAEAERSIISLLLSRTTLAHALAGCVGSMLAMSLTYPLDRIRVMKQLSDSNTQKDGDVHKKNVFDLIKELLDKDGVNELYRGIQPMVITLGTSNFVYFYWYTALKAIWQRYYKLGTLGNLVLATVAGVVNVLITNPLWVAYMRLVMKSKGKEKEKVKDSNQGLLGTLMEIADKEGVESLWSGMMPSLILVSNPTVQFVSYEKLKQSLLSLKLGTKPGQDILLEDGDILGAKEYFFLGAAAKLIATLVTYPLQIAQTRLRADVKAVKQEEPVGVKGDKSKKLRRQMSVGQYAGTLDCLLHIFRKDGISGWYRGIDAKIMQTCLNAAFMFTAYEKIYAVIFRTFVRNRRR